MLYTGEQHYHLRGKLVAGQHQGQSPHPPYVHIDASIGSMQPVDDVERRARAGYNEKQSAVVKSTTCSTQTNILYLLQHVR